MQSSGACTWARDCTRSAWTTRPRRRRSTSRHPHEMIELCSPPSMRSAVSHARRPRLRRGFGIDGVCAQLGGLRLPMAAVARNLSRMRHHVLTTTSVVAILRMSSPAS